MKKISNLKEKMLITVVYIAVVAVFYFLDLSCVFRTFFGIVCPGCGMTRALLALLRFDIASAFVYHPMFWSVPILYAFFLFDHPIFNKKAESLLLVFILGGFLVNWVIKLI